MEKHIHVTRKNTCLPNLPSCNLRKGYNERSQTESVYFFLQHESHCPVALTCVSHSRQINFVFQTPFTPTVSTCYIWRKGHDWLKIFPFPPADMYWFSAETKYNAARPPFILKMTQGADTCQSAEVWPASLALPLLCLDCLLLSYTEVRDRQYLAPLIFISLNPLLGFDLST